MKIRIISDGTGPGTRVVDERGEKVEMVTAVKWKLDDPRGLATAELTFVKVPVEVEGELMGQ